MSYSSEECGTSSPSFPSDDSFQILSRDSIEVDNDTAVAHNQRNHISLTEQDTLAPHHSGEMVEERR